MVKLEDYTLTELRKIASQFNKKVKITAYSKLKKSELIKLLRNHPQLNIVEGGEKLVVKPKKEEPKTVKTAYGEVKEGVIQTGYLKGANLNSDKFLKPLTKEQEDKFKKIDKENENKRKAEMNKREKRFNELSPKAKKNTKLLEDNFMDMRTQNGTKIIKQVLKDMKGDGKFYEHSKILIEGLTKKYDKLVSELKKSK